MRCNARENPDGAVISVRRFVVIGVAMLGMLTSHLAAQDESEIQKAYQKNFVRGNLNTKIQVLQDAANQEEIDMGPLYLLALNFVIDNTRIFENDLLARELTVLCVRLIGISKYLEAVDPLWELFILDDSTIVRVEILNTLGSIKPSDPKLIRSINRWLSGQNEKFAEGQEFDVDVVEEAVVTLGRIGDDSSFPVLFTVSLLGSTDNLERKAREALYSIEGNFRELVLRVIKENALSEKLEALRIAVNNEELLDGDKAVIAEAGLSLGLNTSATNNDDRELLRQIRYESVRVLIRSRWAASTSDVIAHFDNTLQELALGIGRKSHVLDAIMALGAMSTHEAAVRLAVYLDVLNSDMENGKTVDDEVVLAVIQNLGLLGDKIAFDYLLYAGYLDYSDTIKKAARDALNRL